MVHNIEKLANTGKGAKNGRSTAQHIFRRPMSGKGSRLEAQRQDGHLTAIESSAHTPTRTASAPETCSFRASVKL